MSGRRRSTSREQLTSLLEALRSLEAAPRIGATAGVIVQLEATQLDCWTRGERELGRELAIVGAQIRAMELHPTQAAVWRRAAEDKLRALLAETTE